MEHRLSLAFAGFCALVCVLLLVLPIERLSRHTFSAVSAPQLRGGSAALQSPTTTSAGAALQAYISSTEMDESPRVVAEFLVDRLLGCTACGNFSLFTISPSNVSEFTRFADITCWQSGSSIGSTLSFAEWIGASLGSRRTTRTIPCQGCSSNFTTVHTASRGAISITCGRGLPMGDVRRSELIWSGMTFNGSLVWPLALRSVTIAMAPSTASSVTAFANRRRVDVQMPLRGVNGSSTLVLRRRAEWNPVSSDLEQCTNVAASRRAGYYIVSILLIMLLWTSIPLGLWVILSSNRPTTSTSPQPRSPLRKGSTSEGMSYAVSFNGEGSEDQVPALRVDDGSLAPSDGELLFGSEDGEFGNPEDVINQGRYDDDDFAEPTELQPQETLATDGNLSPRASVKQSSSGGQPTTYRPSNTIVGFVRTTGTVAHVIYDGFEESVRQDPFEAERISGDFLGDVASIAKTLDGFVVRHTASSVTIAWNAAIPRLAHQTTAVRFRETVKQRLRSSNIKMALSSGVLYTSRNTKPNSVVGPAIDRALALSALQILSGHSSCLATEEVVFAMADQGRGKAHPVDLVALSGEDESVMVYAFIDSGVDQQLAENEAQHVRRLFSALQGMQLFQALSMISDLKDPSQRAHLNTLVQYSITALGSERLTLSDGYVRAQLGWRTPAEFFGETKSSATGGHGALMMSRKMRTLKNSLSVARTPTNSDAGSGFHDSTSAAGASISQKPVFITPTSGISRRLNSSISANTTGDHGKVGTVVSNYEFLPVSFKDNKNRKWRISQGKVLGRKDSSKVFLGMSDDGLPVAIRTVDVACSDDEWSLVLNGSVTAACVKHRHAMEVHSVTRYNDAFLLIVCEYVPGGKLSTILAEFGGLLLEPTRRYAKELLDVIRYLQRNRIVHGCIMPSSIMLGMDGNLKLKSFDRSLLLPKQGHALGDESLSHMASISSLSNLTMIASLIRQQLAKQTEKHPFLAPELLKTRQRKASAAGKDESRTTVLHAEGDSGMLFDLIQAGPVLGQDSSSSAPDRDSALPQPMPTSGLQQSASSNLSEDGHHINTDIYGYGMTVLQMLLGAHAPPDHTPSSKELKTLIEGSTAITNLPQAARAEAVASLVSLLSPCFDKKPYRRPTSEQLAHHPFFM